jgi:D-alanyl-D-alanine carboxypeptidase-like protein
MRRPVAGARVRASAAATVLALLALAVTSCAGGADSIQRTGARTGASTSGTPTVDPSGSSTAAEDPSAYAVPDPGHLRTPLYTPDLLLTSSRPIPASVRAAVARVRGVRAVMPLSLASLSANGRTLTIAAADPAQFRRFTAYASARSDAVWKRVAGGEIAVDPGLPARLEEPKGYLRLGTSGDAPQVHIGAYAPLVKQISAVVNDKRGEQLGMPRGNALLVSTGTFTPSAVTPRLKKVVGRGLTMQTLALEFTTQVQTAVLSGSSVTSRVGTFTYTPHPDGTVTPDAGWVRSYIRTEQVPILGPVTCNKGMIPQLRAALSEVVDRGLADKIHPGEYAGCYYPRYIANDPAKGLSLHSWGIAVDLNVPGNQRGTVGEMDRQVVAIFKKWGFAWGGDWNYTDPMHFEMASVVNVR